MYIFIRIGTGLRSNYNEKMYPTGPGQYETKSRLGEKPKWAFGSEI